MSVLHKRSTNAIEWFSFRLHVCLLARIEIFRGRLAPEHVWDSRIRYYFVFQVTHAAYDITTHDVATSSVKTRGED